VVRTATLVLVIFACGGCSSLLPHSEDKTASTWTTYQDAQKTFDRIVPGKTTEAELKTLDLDPSSNANIAILNYADVLRRFMVSQAVSFSDLDAGVLECVTAKTLCRGFEVDQKLVRTHRRGNFWLDLLGFRRETRIAGWHFNGIVLLKGQVVVYKLTGGQPSIDQQTDSNTPLGPVQSLAGKFLVWSPPGGGN